MKPQLSEFKPASTGGKTIRIGEGANPFVGSLYIQPSWDTEGKFRGSFGGGRSFSILDFDPVKIDKEFNTEQEALDFLWRVAEKWKKVIEEMSAESEIPLKYKEGGILNKKVTFKQLFQK